MSLILIINNINNDIVYYLLVQTLKIDPSRAICTYAA